MYVLRGEGYFVTSEAMLAHWFRPKSKNRMDFGFFLFFANLQCSFIHFGVFNCGKIGSCEERMKSRGDIYGLVVGEVPLHVSFISLYDVPLCAATSGFISISSSLQS